MFCKFFQYKAKEFAAFVSFKIKYKANMGGYKCTYLLGATCSLKKCSK